jgi:hypothetical protein
MNKVYPDDYFGSANLNYRASLSCKRDLSPNLKSRVIFATNPFNIIPLILREQPNISFVPE